MSSLPQKQIIFALTFKLKTRTQSILFYRLQWILVTARKQKLRKGNVFIPPSQTPLADNLPARPPMATAADGMHPTGMHSCHVTSFVDKSDTIT